MNASVSSRLRFLIVIACCVVILDQITKYLVIGHLTHAFHMGGEVGDNLVAKWQRFFSATHPLATEPFIIFPSWWDFQYVENPGAAWGILANVSESVRGPFFALVSLVAFVLISTYYFRAPEKFVLRRVSLALLLGGAIGNFIDRSRMHYVIDFVHWHVGEAFHWPTFNIADSAISVGVVLLLIESFLHPEKPPEKSLQRPPAKSASKI